MAWVRQQSMAVAGVISRHTAIHHSGAAIACGWLRKSHHFMYGKTQKNTCDRHTNQCTRCLTWSLAGYSAVNYLVTHTSVAWTKGKMCSITKLINPVDVHRWADILRKLTRKKASLQKQKGHFTLLYGNDCGTQIC